MTETPPLPVLRSIAFNVLFFTGTPIWLIFMLVFMVLPPAGLRWAVRIWAGYMMFCLKWTVGLTYEIRGRENIPPGPVLIASKHQSAWDTAIFLLLIDSPVYIIKQELFGIPLWGWYARRYGNIGVDRKAGGSALKKMAAGSVAVLESGRSVVIFPEGTRTAPGARQPYHPGIASVYTRIEAPVVPVALNSGLFWGRRTFMKKPGRVLLEFLPPIPKGLERRAFMAELENRIETATDRLMAESLDQPTR
ncbi:MAG: 1-acyl-sn-glycerol-3-phosphate acyltransferase [Magnetospirillum sp. WYHS-4]